MAISYTHYQLLKLLKDRGELPQGGRILEIGKANWYGDAPASVVNTKLVDEKNGYIIVEHLYQELMWPGPGDLVAIDNDPAAVERGAVPHDLNTLEIGSGDQCFDFVVNHGTLEHLLNVGNGFRVMHDACKPGGLMVHETPYRGWDDHGFYCLQPNLFEAISRENGYQSVLLAVEHLRSQTYLEFDSYDGILEARRRDQMPDHSMLFVAMRKTVDAAFKIPTQAIYCGAASPFRSAMWRELR